MTRRPGARAATSCGLTYRLCERLIRHACRRLPAGTAADRYEEWAAEAWAVLTAPGAGRLRGRVQAFLYAADITRAAVRLPQKKSRSISAVIHGNRRYRTLRLLLDLMMALGTGVSAIGWGFAVMQGRFGLGGDFVAFVVAGIIFVSELGYVCAWLKDFRARVP